MTIQGRIVCVPKEYSQPLEELGWSQEKIARTFIQIIEIFLASSSQKERFFGREVFNLSSQKHYLANRYVRKTFGSGLNMTMQLLREQGILSFNNFKWQ